MKKSLLIALGITAVGLARADLALNDSNTNYVGSQSVSLSTEYTILAVPFAAYLDQSATSIALDKLVSTYGLAASDTAASADQLVVFQDSTYKYFYLSSTGWKPLQTVTAGGATTGALATAVSDVKLAKGDGVWLKRATAATAAVYLQGRVAAGQATTIAKGMNLIGSGYPTALALNSILTTKMTWPSDVGQDSILVPTASGYDTYKYEGSTWQKATQTQNGTIPGTTIPKYVTSYSAISDIPAGVGFWYHRVGETSFTFNPATSE